MKESFLIFKKTVRKCMIYDVIYDYKKEDFMTLWNTSKK